VMSPKKLLRYPKAVSTMEDLANGTFHEVLPETLLADPKKVETVIFVSGKLYYELLEEREKNKNEKTALVRLEQIYPFPAQQVAAVIRSYPKLKNVAWSQEEPKNMGSFQHVFFKFQDLFAKENLRFDLKYVGRPERSSPATGSLYRHNVEQSEILKAAFNVGLT
jgi:2-oxoglutarate dehydrogenase E1 component